MGGGGGGRGCGRGGAGRGPAPRPPPRAPRGPGARGWRGVRRWYERELGWAAVPGRPPRLPTGVRFDVLDVPAEAGAGALRHLAPGSPVALRGDRMELLVAAGGAEELPGLLEWLEWGAVALDLRALGAGDALAAPLPPGWPPSPSNGLSRAVPGSRSGGAPGCLEGAAVWLRPPEPGREAEALLPAMPAMGREGCAPDLVRLVDTVAACCHRVRLRRAAGLAEGVVPSDR
ncbi:SCO3374 family protein [Streptomyces misionensis]|uniref:SCO3374 family protein n=1 Tax=Streptomyces misionensis TaxID=67331 RepID=UPI001C97F387